MKSLSIWLTDWKVNKNYLEVLWQELVSQWDHPGNYPDQDPLSLLGNANSPNSS